MKYKAVIKKIRNINIIDAEISLGFGIKINACLRLLGISSLKDNDRLNEAIKYLQDTLIEKEGVEIDIKLAKEHSLAIVYLNGKNINQDLLSKNLAKKYEIKAKNNG